MWDRESTAAPQKNPKGAALLHGLTGTEARKLGFDFFSDVGRGKYASLAALHGIRRRESEGVSERNGSLLFRA